MHLHAILLAIGTVAVRHAISQRELRLWIILFFYVGAGRPICGTVLFVPPRCTVCECTNQVTQCVTRNKESQPMG